MCVFEELIWKLSFCQKKKKKSTRNIHSEIPQKIQLLYRVPFNLDLWKSHVVQNTYIFASFHWEDRFWVHKISLIASWFIAVPVPSQKNERPCIWLLEISKLPQFFSLLGFRIVQTLWCTLEINHGSQNVLWVLTWIGG